MRKGGSSGAPRSAVSNMADITATLPSWQPIYCRYKADRARFRPRIIGAASRLLDDVTARGADNATGAPAGLERLTQIDWPPGTVFTRSQLEAARDGRPYTEE